jgi:hypothetical protein
MIKRLGLSLVLTAMIMALCGIVLPVMASPASVEDTTITVDSSDLAVSAAESCRTDKTRSVVYNGFHSALYAFNQDVTWCFDKNAKKVTRIVSDSGYPTLYQPLIWKYVGEDTSSSGRQSFYNNSNHTTYTTKRTGMFSPALPSVSFSWNGKSWGSSILWPGNRDYVWTKLYLYGTGGYAGSEVSDYPIN